MDNHIHILVSFDKNYIEPFQVMLKSATMNNPGEQFHIWLLHSGLDTEALEFLQTYCDTLGCEFTAVLVERTFFADAPVSKRYPQEMYYRLLAAQLLPDTLERILYLDPDILVINSLRPLWKLELHDAVFAAAAHSLMPDMVHDVNRIRLDTEHDYYNTGVLLIELSKARELVKADDIYDHVEKHALELVLPDQDVFNSLYGKYTLQLDDKIWNYDARHARLYQLNSEGVCNLDWVMQHTVVLHFCGKKKPWKTNDVNRFGVLYKHYRHLALQ